MFKPGDKVKYIGDLFPNLYINKKDTYTIKKRWKSLREYVQLIEIEKIHGYAEENFIRANSHIIREKLGIK